MTSQHVEGLPSLVQQDTAQLRLFGSSEMEGAIFAADELRGTYTGERLYKSDPERYQMIVSLLSEGLAIRQIARLTKTSINTVMAVRDREPELVEAEKKLIGRKMRGTVRLIVDKVIEQLAAGSLEINNVRDLQSMLVGAGILTDKSELLMGGPTARVEHRDSVKVGDLEDLWQALPADVIDVDPDPPAMGLAGDTRDPKGEPAGAQGDEPGEAAASQSTDNLSNGSEA